MTGLILRATALLLTIAWCIYVYVDGRRRARRVAALQQGLAEEQAKIAESFLKMMRGE